MEAGVGLAVSVFQAQAQADEAAAVSVDLFRREKERLLRHHAEGMNQRTAFYFEQVSHAKARHCDSIVLKKTMAAKEAMYDHWQQHNEMYKARIISATLMFGCGYNSLADGNQQIPRSMDGETQHLVIYSTLVASGIALMLICILSLVILYRRLSRFDASNRLTRCPRCKKAHRHFQEFFQCSCAKHDRFSLLLFYAGSLVTFAGAVSLQLMKFRMLYTMWNPYASAAMLVGCGLPAILLGMFGNIVWPSNTRSTEAGPTTPGVTSPNLPFE